MVMRIASENSDAGFIFSLNSGELIDLSLSAGIEKLSFQCIKSKRHACLSF
jgi:hypothetical protein